MPCSRQPQRWLVLVLVAAACLVTVGTAHAQPQPQHAEKPPGVFQKAPGHSLTVRVLTFGPGDHPFFKFGHNSIWIHDAAAPSQKMRDRVYNYGTFGFESWKVIPQFFFGRFRYWLSVQGWESTLRYYRTNNRTVAWQELDLEPERRALLRDLLEENLKGDNIYYKYDYYRDNCSTRVRDIIDKVTDDEILARYRADPASVPELLGSPAHGRLREAVTGEGSMTYRAHTLRLTHSLAVEYVVLDVVLGPLVDRPITLWEETFLPEKLADLLSLAKVVGPDGTERPLVKGERTEFTARRPAALAEPPNWLPWYGLFGLYQGALFVALCNVGRGRLRKDGTPRALTTGQRIGRILASIYLGLQGFVAGFLGVFYILVWIFTDHEVGYANWNMLLLAPWLIALPFFSVGLARGRVRTTRRIYKLLLAALVACGLGLVLKVIPWFRQDNFRLMAYALPVWGLAAFGVRRLLTAAEAREAAAAKAPVER
ncbi:MAG: DUF4105 domain-containing protein [Polyangiaceae bacterium]|nr:DUF4105 domain-containing protein [Polyangiaceae bacterium]